MGDNPQKPGDDGVDLLSKLFDDVSSDLDGKTEAFSPKTNAVDESTGSADGEDLSRTEMISKPDHSFSPPSKTHLLEKGDDATEMEQASADLFDAVLKNEPLPDEKISFFELKPDEIKKAPPPPTLDEATLQEEPLELEAAGSDEDPIDAALNLEAEIPGQQMRASPSSSSIPSEEPGFKEGHISEISASDFSAPSAGKEDLGEVFAHNPIQVAEITKARRSLLSPALRKILGAAAGVLIVGGGGFFGFQKISSDAGLLGYRLDGLSLVKAYQPPTDEQRASFEPIFDESEKAILNDSPDALLTTMTKLKGIMEIDERNVEAISRMLDQSVILMGWFGTSSPWSQKFDEGLSAINSISEKSKNFVDSLIIARAKARKSFILGDAKSARTDLEAAMTRFGQGDDASYLLMAEVSLALDDPNKANEWLSKVSDKKSNKTRYLHALISKKPGEMEELAKAGYLPARVAVLNTMSRKSADDLEGASKKADELSADAKDFPNILALVKEFNGDIAQELGDAKKARALWKEVLSQFPRETSLWLKLAKSFEEDALWDEALEAYVGIEKTGGLNQKSFLRYSELLRLRGRFVDAGTLLGRALEKFPQSAELYSLQGQVFLDLFQSDKAKESFKKALEIDPKHEPTILAQVRLAMEEKSYGDATRWLKMIPTESPRYSQALLSLGQLEVSQNNRSSAEQYFDDARRLNPKLEEVYPPLVDLQLLDQRDDVAEKVVEAGVKALPRSPYVLIAKAKILMYQRKFDEAVQTLEPFQKSHDHLTDLRLMMIDAQIEAKKFSEASADITDLVTKNIRSPEFSYLRAKLFFRDQGNTSKDINSPETAQKLLEAALKQAPHVDKYHALMARLALRMQDKQVATEALKTLLKQNPNSAEALLIQGDFQMDGGQYEAASKSFQDALKHTKFRSEIYGRLAEAFRQLNQPAAAISYYQKVLSERPRDAEAHLELGKLLNQEGRYQGAVASFKKALSLNSKMPEAYYYLGFAQKELGDNLGALKSFEAFLDLEPEGTESATIRDEVFFLKRANSPN